MSGIRSRPADVLLDLLRSVGERGHSVRFLVDAGALFEFSENRVRVTLSRLLTRGLIESPARGRYRLAARTDALNEFVERWRLGEARVRPWTPGEWLFAHLAGPPTGTRWALDALGFREVRPGLFARPDNLQLEAEALRRLARGIGAAPELLLIRGRPDGDGAGEDWRRSWQPEALAAVYEELRQRLSESAARIGELPLDRARLESFRLGGEAIHRLVKDPLLPEQWLDPSLRAALVRETLAYDAAGKAVWATARGREANALPVPQLPIAAIAAPPMHVATEARNPS
jgi:phenylacetic acid degradation operon negative regulatory protein